MAHRRRSLLCAAYHIEYRSSPTTAQSYSCIPFTVLLTNLLYVLTNLLYHCTCHLTHNVFLAFGCSRLPCWMTSLAVCLYGNRDVYVCQYKARGLVAFKREPLTYRRIAFSTSASQEPEGVAFAHGCMYVQVRMAASRVCFVGISEGRDKAAVLLLAARTAACCVVAARVLP